MLFGGMTNRVGVSSSTSDEKGEALPEGLQTRVTTGRAGRKHRDDARGVVDRKGRFMRVDMMTADCTMLIIMACRISRTRAGSLGTAGRSICAGQSHVIRRQQSRLLAASQRSDCLNFGCIEVLVFFYCVTTDESVGGSPP